MDKNISASGGEAPLTPTRGFNPGPRWGLRSKTPVIGIPPQSHLLPLNLLGGLGEGDGIGEGCWGGSSPKPYSLPEPFSFPKPISFPKSVYLP